MEQTRFREKIICLGFITGHFCQKLCWYPDESQQTNAQLYEWNSFSEVGVFWILERSKSKNRHSCHRIRRGMVLDSFYLPDLATKFSKKKKLLNTSIAWAKSEGLDRIGASLYFYWMHQEIVWPFKGEIGWFRRQQFAISYHFTFILDFWRFAKHIYSISV